MSRRSRSLSPPPELVEPEVEPPLLEVFPLLPELKLPGLAELLNEPLLKVGWPWLKELPELKELPVVDGVLELPPKRAV